MLCLSYFFRSYGHANVQYGQQKCYSLIYNSSLWISRVYCRFLSGRKGKVVEVLFRWKKANVCSFNSIFYHYLAHDLHIFKCQPTTQYICIYCGIYLLLCRFKRKLSNMAETFIKNYIGCAYSICDFGIFLQFFTRKNIILICIFNRLNSIYNKQYGSVYLWLPFLFYQFWGIQNQFGDC